MIVFGMFRGVTVSTASHRKHCRINSKNVIFITRILYLAGERLCAAMLRQANGIPRQGRLLPAFLHLFDRL